jgi:hypothetical protein
MTFEALVATTLRLQSSLDALAALGAELRIRREGLPVDPRLAAALRDVIAALDPRPARWTHLRAGKRGTGRR